MPLNDTNDPGVRADREHYERDNKSLLDSRDFELVGEVNDEEKSAFLGNALASLFPFSNAE